jgi:hypothetical protein
MYASLASSFHCLKQDFHQLQQEVARTRFNNRQPEDALPAMVNSDDLIVILNARGTTSLF